MLYKYMYKYGLEKKKRIYGIHGVYIIYIYTYTYTYIYMYIYIYIYAYVRTYVCILFENEALHMAILVCS